ncbi:MAG: sigma-70 region 4 domain-containing protein, partial [Myxococcales bacterium]|nr:sigma-70 region 4 domain-containing protein [Myxococcales bacterium]
RTCLTAVLSCLPPGVRMAFILTDLMGFEPAPGARLLDIKESAYRVRLTRARKRIEDYLTPRCQHVDDGNPCNCEGRLAISLDKRFLRPPSHTKDIPDEPFDSGSPHGTVMPVYRTLPLVQLSNSRSQELLALFDAAR